MTRDSQHSPSHTGTFGWLYNSLQPKSQTGLAFIYDERGNPLATHGNGSWQWHYSAFGANKATGVLNTVTTTNAAGVTTTQLKATTPTLDHKLRFTGRTAIRQACSCR